MKSNFLEEVRDKQRKAALKRKRGDLMARKERKSEAKESYTEALARLDEALEILRAKWDHPDEADGPLLPEEQKAIAKELVETYGARGGILRRLDEKDKALTSYQEGAKVEWRSESTSTYNRVNSIKYSLLTGQSKLDDTLREEIKKITTTLSQQLDENPKLGDSGWAWADLGDCRALLSDVNGAEQAYRVFINKADTKAPKTTLDILREVSKKLKSTADPAMDSVERALKSLEERL